MSIQRLHIVLLLACAALAGTVLLLSRPPPAAQPSLPAVTALDAIPTGAALLATVDMQRLRASGLSAAIQGRGVPGLGSLVEVCGYDPTASLESLALVVPANQAPLDTASLGLSASGDLRRDRLLDCAERSIERRGGTPVRTRIGSFTVVRDRKRAGMEIALRSGLALVAGGELLREMIDTADGQVPSIQRDEVHGALRRTLGSGLVLVTLKLAPGWLDAVIEPELAAASPLSKIATAALRVQIEPTVELTLVLGCRKADDCGDVHAFMRRSASDLQAFMERQLGLRLEGLKLQAEQSAVLMQLSMSPEQAKRALGLLLDQTD